MSRESMCENGFGELPSMTQMVDSELVVLLLLVLIQAQNDELSKRSKCRRGSDAKRYCDWAATGGFFVDACKQCWENMSHGTRLTGGMTLGRWREEQRLQMSPNLPEKHYNRASTEALCGRATVAASASRFHAPKYSNETFRCIKSPDYATKRKCDFEKKRMVDDARMYFRSNEEYWEPVVDGLEEIVVKRNIPCVHILLSLDEIDPTTVGYFILPSSLLQALLLSLLSVHLEY